MAAATWSVLVVLTAASAAAQSTIGGAKGQPWLMVGGASTTILSDCPDCDADGNYRHAASFVANAGVSLNERAEIGAEVTWVPSTAITGDHIRTTFVMGGVQVRPWVRNGFSLKAMSGMAFVRNWVVDLSGGGDPAPPFTSKAFALGIGAGWEWRLRNRLGVQVFGTQNVAALGDLQTSQRRVENVVGNFWSIGAGIVFR
jgi:hypothetical protein